MSDRSGSSARFSSSTKIKYAAAAVIESLERRSLLSAGDVLSTAITDVGLQSDTGGAVVRLADQSLAQVGVSHDELGNSVFSLAHFGADGHADGVVTTNFPDPSRSLNSINAATVDGSGRIIVVGSAGADFFVSAFQANGQLDESFGTAGIAVGEFTAGSNEARAVAIGVDGTIFVAGGSTNEAQNLFGLARFSSDGILKGIAQTPTLGEMSGFHSADIVHALAIDSSGNVLLAGSSLASFNNEVGTVIALQRYAADGTLDTSFGVAGSVRFDVPAAATALGDKAYSLAVDEHDRILVGGTTDGPIGSSDDFVLLRFTSDGGIDTDFNAEGEAGIVRTNFGGFSSGLISDLAIQSDGAIVAGGNVLFCTDDSCGEGFNRFAVARYDASGRLDSRFGSGLVPGVVLSQHFQVNGQGLRPEMNLGTLALQSDANQNHSVALGSWIPWDFGDNDPSSDNLALVRFALSGLAVKITGPTSANEGDTIHLTANFSGALAEGVNFVQEQHRAEGTAAPRPSVTYDWSITLDGKWLASGSGTGLDTLDIPFAPADDGTYQLAISINDGAASDSFDVTVHNVNPTATINDSPASSAEGTAITVAGSVSDPGADTFTYAWSVLKGGLAYASGAGTSFSFTPDDNEIYQLTLTITDDDGGIGTDSRLIEVNNLAPTATINGAPATSLEGSKIDLSGAASDPGSADTFTYAWSVTKDGAAFSSGTGSAFSFTPDDNGRYSVALTITDDDGGVGSDSSTIDVTNVNPSATITNAPESSDEGTAIKLGSNVSDIGSADTFSYAWQVTKNGSPFASGSDSTFTFTPDDNGTYNLSLTVTDDDGGVGIASSTIAATNVAPNAAIKGAPASSAEGSLISLTSTASDAGSADTFTYAWAVTKNGSSFASGSSANFSFTPNDNGAYIVSLTVTDDDGGIGSASSSIAVTNVAPTAAITGAPAGGAEGSAISLGSSVSDPGSDTFVLAWAVSKNGSAYTSGSGSNFSFTPNDNGSYVITLTATDDDGGVGSDSRMITIVNVGPTVAPVSGPTSGQQGSAQTFNSSFTDPGSADTWTITWNFGDGTSQSSAGTTGAISASHTYLAAGTYTVSVTVADDDGGSAAQSSSITIANTNNTTLNIQGTAGSDNITIKLGFNGALIVTVNGVVSTKTGITQIVINAGAGDDRIKVGPEVTQSAIVFAGDGDDSVKTGAGDDIIVGGNGSDLLHGNDGRDILIGGRGPDRIVGNADSDILVAAYTVYDANQSALSAVQAEWTSSRSFGQRTANVMGRDVTVAGVKYFFAGPRNNGNTFFAPDGASATVFDDGEVDILSGNAAQDLFLFNSDTCVRDILTDMSCVDYAADIDFLNDTDSSASLSTVSSAA